MTEKLIPPQFERLKVTKSSSIISIPYLMVSELVQMSNQRKDTQGVHGHGQRVTLCGTFSGNKGITINIERDV